jgi:uncharacterized LabA/DUF88 family protein
LEKLITGRSTDIKQFGAIFIDFENVILALTNQFGFDKAEAMERAINIITTALESLKSVCETIMIRQAFADWGDYSDASKLLYPMGVRIINVKSTLKKNSADIELSLCVLETMLTRKEIQALIILAGDRDYMPIATRAMENGKDIHFISFEECFSGDLKQLVGADHCHFVNIEGEFHDAGSNPLDVGDVESPSAAGESDQLSSLTILERKALKAAVDAYEEFGKNYGSVKLSGFLADKLTQALPSLSHQARKSLFDKLVQFGFLNLEMTEGYLGDQFIVFKINFDDPVVKAMMEAE